MHPNMLWFGFACALIGIAAGFYIAHVWIEADYRRTYDEELERERRNALQTIRNSYAREETNRQLMLEELGEVLDVDGVELPTFGYTILRGATKVTEDHVEPHMRDLYE